MQVEHGGPSTEHGHGQEHVHKARGRPSRLGSIRECGAIPPIERRRMTLGSEIEQHSLLRRGRRDKDSPG